MSTPKSRLDEIIKIRVEIEIRKNRKVIGDLEFEGNAFKAATIFPKSMNVGEIETKVRNKTMGKNLLQVCLQNFQ